MRQKLASIFFAGTLLFATGCASIVSRNRYPITITSVPTEARVVITNNRGVAIYTGNTPAVLSLKAGNGFFSKAGYQVTFEKEGYDTKVVPIEFKLDAWYFGNVIFGGLVGLLIVDPATGAMFRLKTDFLHETLARSTAHNVEKEQLKVYSLDEIPDNWKSHLVAMDENTKLTIK